MLFGVDMSSQFAFELPKVSNYNSMHHRKGGETDCNEEAAQASQSRAIDTRVPSSLISPPEIDSGTICLKFS